MRKRVKWLLVLMTVTAGGLAYASYSFFAHTEANYLTIGELKSQAESFYGQQTRVEGRIAPGTVDWDGGAQILRFVLADDGESLAVIFQGVAPDEFKPGAELIVEGQYRADGVLEAASFGSRRSICNLCH